MSGLRVELARPEDEPELRRLLRASPMAGAVRLTLEREPDLGQAAAVEGERHARIVLRDETGRVLGMGARSVQRVFWEGRPRRVGYLAQLRLAPGLRLPRRLTAEGYRLLLDARQADELPFDYTSILSDNVRARRLLEAGLPGLPRYTPLARYVTLTLPVGRPRRVAPPAGVELGWGRDQDVPEIAACLDELRRERPLAACWTADELRSPIHSRGLSSRDFLLARQGGRLAACAALWDQRAYKQVVVRGYAPWLGRLRPWHNLVAPLLRRPALPPPGRQLATACVSHLAVPEGATELFVALLAGLWSEAGRRGLPWLLVGLSAESPWLAQVTRVYPHRRDDSQLYAVGEPVPQARPCQPELALL